MTHTTHVYVYVARWLGGAVATASVWVYILGYLYQFPPTRL